jgi:hypothetical protein
LQGPSSGIDLETPSIDRPPERRPGPEPTMRKPVRFFLLTALLWMTSSAIALAQTVPVSVTISGNTATASIGLPGATLAELILSFDDASGLSAGSLGISAELVDSASTALLARLPDASLTSLPAALPVLITVEPPSLGGLSFRRTVGAEIHTHLLAYTAGSPYRVFKAPLGGGFRDITREVAAGSVRARSSTGAFSQFLILADLRPSATVIAQKFAWLRSEVAGLSAPHRGLLEAHLDAAEAAVAGSQWADAIFELDAFSAYVSAQAGSGIPQQWRALRDQHNRAGELLSGAATLRFSIGYLRDYGL